MALKEIARIVHVSDFHLFVDKMGADRPVKDRSWRTRAIMKVANSNLSPQWIQKLRGGLAQHSRAALDAFIRHLGSLARMNSSCKKFLVQTGDVEAYGGTQDDNGAWTFESYDFCCAIRRHLETHFDKVIDIYGNHDVWPSTIPIANPLATQAVEKALRQYPEFPRLMPCKESFSSEGVEIELYPVNTVIADVMRNTLSCGRIQEEQPIRSGSLPDYPISHKSHLS